MGLPILSPQESLGLKPDMLCLCVLDDMRSQQMQQQIRALGYTGDFLHPNAFLSFDVRTATMRLLAQQIEELGIPGDVAELGVYKGDFARLIALAFPGRTLHLFDSFEGFPPEDVALEQEGGYSGASLGDFSDSSMELVQRRLPPDSRAEFYKGRFPGTFPKCRGESFAFVSIDADLYAPTAAALELFWPRLSPGGVLMVHDVTSLQYTGPGKALREFCSRNALVPLPLCDLHGTALLRKQLDTV